MKKIILLVTLYALTITNSFAAAKPSFICIGNEELNIHKNKIGGHYRKLNQEIISHLVQLGESTMVSKDVLEVICDKSNTYPSVDLLYFLLTKKHKVFYSKSSKFDRRTRTMDQLAVTSFVEKAPHILASFINSIQAQASRPNCLVNMIPNLKNFYYKARYTLEDVGVKRMMKELKDVRSIFLKLKDPKLNKACF